MREITVPPTVVIMNRQTKQPLLVDGKPLTKAFKDYMFDVVLNDQRACTSNVEQASWAKVIDKVCDIPDESPEGFKVRLRDAEYARVITIAREPKSFYAPLIGTQLGSFPEALEAALEVDETKSVPQLTQAAPEASA